MRRHMLSIIIPSFIIGFVLFVWISKWLHHEEIDPLQKDILALVTPVLNQLYQSNEPRFINYNTPLYKKDVEISVPYGRILLIEYASDGDPKVIEQDQNRIYTQFKKHLCRYSSFRQLHHTLQRLSKEHNTSVEASIRLNAFDKERFTLYWSIDLKPSDCVR